MIIRKHGIGKRNDSNIMMLLQNKWFYTIDTY